MYVHLTCLLEHQDVSFLSCFVFIYPHLSLIIRPRGVIVFLDLSLFTEKALSIHKLIFIYINL